MEIGERIALLRRRGGLRQIDLAEKLYVSPKTISKWENGYGLPDIRILPQLASVLGINTDFLLSGDPAKEQAYMEELSAKGAAQESQSKALPNKKERFSLYFCTVLHHQLTIWIILCNIVLIVLSFLAVPIIAKNAAADGSELFYSGLSLFYSQLTDGSPDLTARGCTFAIHTLWLVVFLPLDLLFVIAIIRQARGRNEGGILLASIPFGVAFLLFLSACIGSLCVNFTAGEVYLYPGWSFAVFLLFTFLHLLLQILVGMHGKSIRPFQILSLVLSALLAVCAIGGCIFPHTVVPTALNPRSIQVFAWNIQTDGSDSSDIVDETGSQNYNYVIRSRLTIRANTKIKSLAAVDLTYRRTSVEGETDVEQTYFLIKIEHNETAHSNGAYDNVFSVEVYLTKNEGETLSDFRFSFTVPDDPSLQIFSAESTAIL